MSKCYVGICKCGKITAAVVAEAYWSDDPKVKRDYLKQVGEDVAGFIKAGLTIEQRDTTEVRVTLERCACVEPGRLI